MSAAKLDVTAYGWAVRTDEKRERPHSINDGEVKRQRLFVRHGDTPLRNSNKNGLVRARNVPVCRKGHEPHSCAESNHNLLSEALAPSNLNS